MRPNFKIKLICVSRHEKLIFTQLCIKLCFRFGSLMYLMELFPFLVLLQVILTTLLNIAIIYKSVILLRAPNIRLKVSPTLMLFVYYLIVLSSTMIIYCSYLLIFWRPVEYLYTETLIYVIGFPSWILLISNPIFEFCLCLERCSAVCFPFQYNLRWKKIFAVGTVALVLIYIALNIWINNLFYISEVSLIPCTFFTCIVYNVPGRKLIEFKIVASVLDIFAAGTLILLMKFRLSASTHSTGKSRNRVILIIIFITVILELAPNLIDRILRNVSAVISSREFSEFRVISAVSACESLSTHRFHWSISNCNQLTKFVDHYCVVQ